MSYNLFLDDLRSPEDAYIYPRRDDNNIIIASRSLKEQSGVENCDWVIVRNYADFVKTLDLLGLPDIVSFDHDLHEEHIQHYYEVTQKIGIIEYANLKHKTGKQCAEAFVQLCQKLNPEKPPQVYVHSANQYGAIEIKNVLSQYFVLE